MTVFLLFLLISCILGLIILYSRIQNLSSDFLQELDSTKTTHRHRESQLEHTISSLQESLSNEQKLLRSREWEYELQTGKLSESLKNVESQLKAEILASQKLLSQKKSSEVRLGHIAEKLAPFLDQFDFEPENCIFLGQPLDYISFDEDMITFIEIKSGNSQLNARQRQIRDLVKAKHVSWKEIRIK